MEIGEKCSHITDIWAFIIHVLAMTNVQWDMSRDVDYIDAT
jgi:hypothetical protein